MSALELAAKSPEETARAGRALAEAAAGQGGVVSLVGPLGAGKTVFAKGVAEGLGIDPARVTSPTFVIAGRYDGGSAALVHVDLYRIEDAGELEAAGLADWLDPDALVLIEWGDRFPDALPNDRLELRIVREDDGTRRLAASAGGAGSQAWLERWRRALDGPQE